VFVGSERLATMLSPSIDTARPVRMSAVRVHGVRYHPFLTAVGLEWGAVQ